MNDYDASMSRPHAHHLNQRSSGNRVVPPLCMVSLGQPVQQKALEDTGVITSITTDGMKPTLSSKLRTQKCLRSHKNSMLGSGGPASDTSSNVQFMASDVRPKRFRNQFKRPKKTPSMDTPLSQLTTIQQLLQKPEKIEIMGYLKERIQILTAEIESRNGQTLKTQILTELPREHDRAMF